MTNPNDRVTMHVYVTPDAHEALHGWAAAAGATVAGTVQALADLGTWNLDPTDPECQTLMAQPLGDHLADVARRARVVDARRRRRPRNGGTR